MGEKSQLAVGEVEGLDPLPPITVPERRSSGCLSGQTI